MKVILDTNVFVSGVFFTGPPYQILQGWRNGKLQLVISQEIFEEYRKVGETLSEQYPTIDLEPILQLVAIRAKFYAPQILPESVCGDPDDDKFLACAVASKTKIIISGDKHLLRVSGFRKIKMIRPRQFVDDYF